MRNKNRPGYINTVVGWIPNSWAIASIGELCELTSGYGFGPRDWGKKGLPIIRIQNLNGNTEFNYYDGPIESKWVVFPGDLLFAWAGVKGVSFGPTIWSGPQGLLNQHIYRIKLSKKIEKEWFYRVLLRVTSQIEKKAHGFKSSLLHIHKSDLIKHFLPLPPISEQKKIAEILSTWDTAIEQTRKLIEAKKRRKKALMQQLLSGRKRLSGVMESWEEFHLGELFKERVDVNCGHLPLLAITGNLGVIPASEIERKDSSSEDKSRYKRIASGDIGYNTMRMWQGVSAVSALEGIVSPAYTICVPKDMVDVRFMGYLFKFDTVINLFRRYSQGLVADTLNLKFHHFAQIKVRIPNRNEQERIAGFLSGIDDEIEILQKQLAALEKQKRGLMQKLLTGEVRVKV
jgi:type I restriction enzyme S subunit